MADGVSFKMVTKPFTDAIGKREALMPGAARGAVRKAGIVVQKAARAKTPVLSDKSVVSAARHKKDWAAYKKGGSTGAAPTSGPVRGLLRASITPSRRLTQTGKSSFSLKVGPRGPRAHLYAQKEEARAGFMAAGEAAGRSAMAAIAQEAFDQVWKE